MKAIKRYEIEKNVPMPEGAGNQKYPWGQMKIGNSIVGASYASLLNSAKTWAARHNKDWRFVCRKTTHIEANGKERPNGLFRIWRVE